MALQQHVAVEDGDTGYCNICPLPMTHKIHVRPPTEQQPLAPVDANEARVGSHHPQTSRDAAAKALPRTGTLKAAIYAIIAHRPGGATDDELEITLDRTHQSVSACRNSLMNDGWIEPLRDADNAPLTRLTRTGNAAICWGPTTKKIGSV